MTDTRKTKILFAKPGLDGHDVGAKIVVRALMEAGFDVTYTGLRKSPEEIVGAAREQKPSVLGLSILSGSHLPVCRKISALLDKAKLSDMLWIVGGNIPDGDHEALEALGIDRVFGIGTSTRTIVDHIRARTS